MKVLVVGAHGKVGQRTMQLMHEAADFEPVAFVRQEDQVKAYEAKGMEARLGNLMGSVEEIQQTMTDIDAIVFSAGAAGSSDANTILVDLDGAVKVMEAAKQAGIKRFVMVSAFGAGERERWSKQIITYYAAKMYADRELQRSGLDETILRPGVLGDGEATGKIRLMNADSPKLEDYTTERWDVAQTILAVLPNPETYHQVYEFVSGGTPIESAF